MLWVVMILYDAQYFIAQHRDAFLSPNHHAEIYQRMKLQRAYILPIIYKFLFVTD
jgi:hypothetical protein